MLHKTTFREIKNSLGRYLAILAIIALGVGFFSGLKVTRSAMVDTADTYISDKSFYDFNLISTLGLTSSDVSYFNKMDVVDVAEGSISQDMLIADTSGNDYTVVFHQLLENLNHVQVIDGRLPKKSNECIVDSRSYSKDDIGKKLVLSQDNTKDNLKKFIANEFTIVGIGKSPYYLNFERGTTSLGNGTIKAFVYVPKDSLDEDYFTELFLTINKSGEIYSSTYDSEVDNVTPNLEKALEERGQLRYKKIYNEAMDEYNDGLKEYKDGLKDYNDGRAEYLDKKSSTESKLAQAYKDLQEGKKSIEDGYKKLDKEKNKLLSAKAELKTNEKELNMQEEEFLKNKPYMPPEQATTTESTLAKHRQELDAGLNKIDIGLKEIERNRSNLDEHKYDLASNRKTYYDNKAKAERELKKAKKELADAKLELDEAKLDLAKGKKEIDDIEKPSTYLLTRESNVGYTCFQNDSNIVDGIAKVFPIFFFLIAGLVCMTTMSRMVDEQRTQIGILKALGYSAPAIMSKYLFYSGSAAFIGTLIGYFGGIYIFPQVIWNAYGIMYDFNSGVHYIFDWKLAIISLIAALFCSMGATYISCKGELTEVPAELIRPKSPKNGKRIWLEYITPLWMRISFLYKVTFRNIFRYKKRFFMMVLGISGCTALLVTGFGIRDSIKNVVDFQYDEIQTFDYSLILKDNFNGDDKKDLFDKVTDKGDQLLFVNEQNLDMAVGNDFQTLKVVSLDEGDFSDFLNLHLDNKSVPFPKDGEIVINEKTAKKYKLSIGNTISLRNHGLKTMEVKISGICENYIYNYAYTTCNTLENGYNKQTPKNSAFIIAKDQTEKSIKESTAKLLKEDYVAGVSINFELKERISQMMNSLDYVVLLIIISAGALAFIVLYNLTNINITERIREIATIKVLGFYPRETSAYVFRENFILTGISAIVGVFLGKSLHTFVINEIHVDLLTFDIRISFLSYVLAIAITFVFAALVNFAMYFKLERISMTESLKSIE